MPFGGNVDSAIVTWIRLNGSPVPIRFYPRRKGEMRGAIVCSTARVGDCEIGARIEIHRSFIVKPVRCAFGLGQDEN